MWPYAIHPPVGVMHLGPRLGCVALLHARLAYVVCVCVLLCDVMWCGVQCGVCWWAFRGAVLFFLFVCVCVCFFGCHVLVSVHVWC